MFIDKNGKAYYDRVDVWKFKYNGNLIYASGPNDTMGKKIRLYITYDYQRDNVAEIVADKLRSVGFIVTGIDCNGNSGYVVTKTNY